jgi:hypothetical protein
MSKITTEKIKTAFVVDSERINHYSDVINYMTRDAINKYVQKYNRQPTSDQISHLSKELTRLIVIRKDLISAGKLTIPEHNILNETHNSLHSRI